MDALAITDSGNLYGAFEFYLACEKNDIKPIIWVEAYIAEKWIQYRGRNDHTYSIILLAKNYNGYKNLIQMVTESYLHGFYDKPRIDFEILKQYSCDVIALSWDIYGEIPQHITTGQEEEFLIKRISWYQNVFGKDDFYLEIQEHADRPNQLNINQQIVELAKKTGTKIVGTLDVHYSSTDLKEAQDLLLCLGSGKRIDDPDRRTFIDGNYSLRPDREMEELFSYAPEAYKATQEIADKIDIRIPYGDLLLPVYGLNEDENAAFDRYKKYIAGTKDDLCELDHEEWLLRYLCYDGLNARYNFGLDEETVFEYVKKLNYDPWEVKLQELSPEQLQEISTHYSSSSKKVHYHDLPQEQKAIIDRLDYELVVIDLMGYNAYFTIVADFINWWKRRNIAVGPGRWSAAWAIIAYLSGITNIDPLKYGLLFERFLNPARVSMPDIDIDFADDKRDLVIDYVRNKYWSDHVAQVCTFGTMAARAAVKDVGRAMGIWFAEMNQFAKLIPPRPGITIKDALDESIELQEACRAQPVYQKIIDNALLLEWTVRQLGVHACAVIIAPSPMTDFCPLQHPPKDDTAIVTQFSAYPLEDIGLLKMDFLGLRNLTIIDRTIRIIKAAHDIDINIDDIDMDDQSVFKVFADGDTTGVFQFESAGMRRYLKELQPNTFEDIIVMVSLYRPGPLQYIPTFIKRKHGKEKVKYPHDSLKDILEVTGGIAVYQEQVMQIVQTFAGFSLGEADILRRAMGKKIKSLMDEQKLKFIDAAVAQWHDRKLADYIFTDIIEPFAGYGFNKSHAACYSMIAYQTAFLKAYYPTEFITSLLVSDEEDTDRVVLEVNEARARWINVLVPDINESMKHFTFIDKDNIRFGLKAIKWLGDAPVEKIIEGRKKEKYSNVVDFIERTGSEVINKKSLEALAKSGALDIFWDRASIISSVEKMSSYLHEVESKASTNQIGLFDMGIDASMEQFELESVDPMSYEDKILEERSVIGMSISWAPLADLDRYVQVKSSGFDTVREFFEKMEEMTDEEAEIAQKDANKDKPKGQFVGYVSSERKIQTKTGDMMLVAECESSFFNFTIVVFPKFYARVAPHIQPGKVVWARWKIARKYSMKEISIEAEQVKVASIWQLREAARRDGLFALPMDESIPDIPSGSKQSKSKSSSKNKTKEYIFEIPSWADKEYLTRLKRFLLEQPFGHTRIYINLQWQKIDTKLAINNPEVLMDFE